jgi:FixJ family two-component response regulator
MTGQARHVVAVVDDDPRILESLGELLESAGYDVQVHSSGRSLLTSGVTNIDCLITDIGMPTMDGFALRHRVKQVRPELPVFLISGRRDLADVQQDGSAEDPLFFRKPYDGHTLLAAIAKALQRAAGRRAGQD